MQGNQKGCGRSGQTGETSASGMPCCERGGVQVTVARTTRADVPHVPIRQKHTAQQPQSSPRPVQVTVARTTRADVPHVPVRQKHTAQQPQSSPRPAALPSMPQRSAPPCKLEMSTAAMVAGGARSRQRTFFRKLAGWRPPWPSSSVMFRVRNSTTTMQITSESAANTASTITAVSEPASVSELAPPPSD